MKTIEIRRIRLNACLSGLAAVCLVGAGAYAQQQTPDLTGLASDQIEQCSTEGDSVVIIKPFETDLGFVPVPSRTEPGKMDFVPVAYSYDRSQMQSRPMARDQFKLVVEVFNENPYPENTWVATEETFYAGPVSVQPRTGDPLNFDMRCVGVRLFHTGSPVSSGSQGSSGQVQKP